MELLGVFAMGVFAGVLGSISSGGGLITIPYLLLFGYHPVDVIGTTRIASLAGGISTVKNFNSKKKINWKIAAKLAVPSAIAGALGPLLLPFIDPHLIVAVIAVTLFLLGFWMLISRNYGIKQKHKLKSEKLVGSVIVFIAMLYAVMFGAGGGAIVINLLVVFFGLKLSRATATGIAIWLFGTGVASLIYIFSGNYILDITIALSLGSFIGGIFGSRYVANRSSSWLRLVLSIVILVSGVKILADLY